ncbi:hypothetical protein DINM_002173 [Dirofilaria immitis]|nr:hypothetical protein [Dirofilaria immitis]
MSWIALFHLIRICNYNNNKQFWYGAFVLCLPARVIKPGKDVDKNASSTGGESDLSELWRKVLQNKRRKKETVQDTEHEIGKWIDHCSTTIAQLSGSSKLVSDLCPCVRLEDITCRWISDVPEFDLLRTFYSDLTLLKM